MSLEDTLSVSGNSNHLGGFLSYYEQQIEERSETGRPLTDAPNYYAWMHIASEQVFYRIRELIYFNANDETAFDKEYKKLLNIAFNNYKFSPDEKETIVLFAKIRHLLVHKGFPNPHVTPSNRGNEIAKGHPFTKEDVWILVNKLREPSTFHELSEKYDIAMGAIANNEKDVELNFGFMQFTKSKKC